MKMQTERLTKTLEYLKIAGPRNLLFIGKEKERMLLFAKELVCSWLDTSMEDLLYHSDFKLFGADGGSLCSDRAEMIQRMASYMPQSNRAVCIVTEADAMTVDLQNKLLKVLEDGEKTLAVIFITQQPLLETILSRCLMVEFQETSIETMALMSEYRCFAVLLASDKNPEMYEKIIKDEWFCQYLEGFYQSYTKIKVRVQLKNILRLAHALKEKDNEYLPNKLEDWQMQAFLCMIRQVFWYVMVSKAGAELPSYVKLGNLLNLYKNSEAEEIYRIALKAEERQKSKGAFTKNDFFELLMFMIPLD